MIVLSGDLSNETWQEQQMTAAARGRKGGRRSRRGEILKAAEKLISSQGLGGVTTRQIAEMAGCSEGALYVHFDSRVALLLAMLGETLPDMLGPLGKLRESLGQGSPHQNLVAAMQGVLRFHRRVLPATMGIVADPELLRAYSRSLARERKGPHLSMAVLSGYIAGEQKLGRIEHSTDAKLVAHVLMSASFFRAFMERFTGRATKPGWDALVRTLLAALAPLATSHLPPRPRRQRSGIR